jgi:hypothetical protein
MLFENAAVTEIHRISQGIPRIINLLCERSLTNAYCSNNALVTKKVVLQSAQEALGDEYQALYWWQNIAVKAAGVFVLMAVLIGSSYFVGQMYGENINSEKIVNSSEISVNKDAIKTIIATPKTTDDEIEKLAEIKDVVQEENLTKEFEIKSNGDQVSAVELKVDKVNEGRNIQAEKPVIVENKANTKVKEKLSVNAVDGVSDDLLARFQSAIDETEQESNSDSSREPTEIVEVDVPALSDMPTWVQNDLPSISFEQHIYTSDGESWVKVNGRDRYEGDTISNGLVLNHIYAQKVILTFKGEQFSLPALSTW